MSLAGILLLICVLPPLHMAEAKPPQQFTTYVVEEGDSWREIAAIFQTPVRVLWRSNGVVHTGLLAAGQRLFVPDTRTDVPATVISFDPTEVDPWQLAVRSGVSPTEVMILNGLDTPAEARGQVLFAPDRTQEVARLPVSPSPLPTPTTVSQPLPQPTTLPTHASTERALLISRMGIQGHFSIPSEDRVKLLNLARKAGFTWVKYQVDWSRMEYLPDKYSVERDKLDEFMHDTTIRGWKVLLSVVKAPDWARAATEEDGPPVDYEAYNDFLRYLIQRYSYGIAAIEVWNEPNLRREWVGAQMTGHEYVRLLAGAYQTIKQERAPIMVISAGLAPTGINDGVNAVDDRLFLRQMYEAGLPAYADAVGIHPYSWANPPWLRCCLDPAGPPTHSDHPSFFFLNTIEDYRAIQAEFDDTSRQLWATEFGWGTMDGLDLPIPEDAAFFASVNQEQQARYIIEAYLMAQEWEFMGPMFLWNLNVATLHGFDPNQAGYSILITLDQPRPAYTLLLETPKIEDVEGPTP